MLEQLVDGTLRVVLASGSPRRKALLARMGFPFEVDPMDVDETWPEGRLTSHYEGVMMLSKRKAEAGKMRHQDALVLAADTLVFLDGEPLGKPKSRDEAREMHLRLAGRTHEVVTGVAIGQPNTSEIVTIYESTLVTFGHMIYQHLEAYLDTGSPMDKAGAYGIQDDMSHRFLVRIEGDWDNVMGLPLNRLYQVFIDN